WLVVEEHAVPGQLAGLEDRAVGLDHLRAAGALVQTVDILGHDGQRTGLVAGCQQLLPAGQSPMRRVRLSIQRGPGEAVPVRPQLLEMVAVAGGVRELLGLGVEPAGAAVTVDRQPRRCGEARPGDHHDMVDGLDQAGHGCVLLQGCALSFGCPTVTAMISRSSPVSGLIAVPASVSSVTFWWISSPPAAR